MTKRFDGHDDVHQIVEKKKVDHLVLDEVIKRKQREITALHLHYNRVIRDCGRLLCSFQTESMGTVPDLNRIITTGIRHRK